MGQLTTATKRDTPSEDALPVGAFEYAFDSIGNRLSAKQGVSAADAYTANANNQISEIDYAGLHPIRGQAHSDALVTLNSNPGTSFNGKFFDALTGEHWGPRQREKLIIVLLIFFALSGDQISSAQQ